MRNYQTKVPQNGGIIQQSNPNSGGYGQDFKSFA